jgi:hypothetical protein
MSKTILALVTAGVLGAAMVSTGANAMVPGNSTTKMTGTQATASQTKLNRERTMLRRDVRLGRTTAAARLRREINANERSISRAKSGGMETPTARSMQPTPPTTPQPPSSTQNSTTSPTGQTNQ